MRIAVATDHGGFPLKKAVIAAVESTGNEVVDLGAFNEESSDYPDFARKAGEAIQKVRRIRQSLFADRVLAFALQQTK